MLLNALTFEYSKTFTYIYIYIWSFNVDINGIPYNTPPFPTKVNYGLAYTHAIGGKGITGRGQSNGNLTLAPRAANQPPQSSRQAVRQWVADCWVVVSLCVSVL